MTNKDMMVEMLDRLGEQVDSMTSTLRVVDALDRDSRDYDLVDQMATAEKLLTQMNALVARMVAIKA
jgi:hypothetical protein